MQHYGCKAWDAKVVEGIEEDDGSIMAVEICDGFECSGEDGVGYDQVQQ